MLIYWWYTFVLCTLSTTMATKNWKYTRWCRIQQKIETKRMEWNKIEENHVKNWIIPIDRFSISFSFSTRARTPFVCTNCEVVGFFCLPETSFFLLYLYSDISISSSPSQSSCFVTFLHQEVDYNVKYSYRSFSFAPFTIASSSKMSYSLCIELTAFEEPVEQRAFN